jgi:anti-anti-sigma regulatory factor
MSKESGGFLRKVARFVANPTTDWTALDAPKEDPGESEYAKGEIKAMIERKRRNDFVRKRELDMLRKIRREGLSPDNALALSSPSNMDPDSRPPSGARSDIAVKAKIDEIELQMVGNASRQPPMMVQAPSPSSAPEHLTDAAATVPHALTAPTTLQYEYDEPPQISQAAFDSARTSAPVMASDTAHAALQRHLNVDSGVHVAEATHDPELDEAVIAFANADFDQCETNLLSLLQPGALRYEQAETWLVLFDLYRALDLQQKFDNMAGVYAQKFGFSAPQWYSLPQKVAALMAHKDKVKSPETDSAAPPTQVSVAQETGLLTRPPRLGGWVAQPSLDQDATASLRIEVLQMPRPWVIDWSEVRSVSPEGAAQLVQLMRQWAGESQELIWIGVSRLLDVLGEASPTGFKDSDPAYWMLKLEVLRLCNRPDRFDETAIDYCVTYERSPPSWEHAKCRVREQTDNIYPHTRPLSHLSEATTSFVESQLHDEVAFAQVATLNLSGQLVGDISPTLSKLEDQLSASVTLEIDCTHLLRVDFIAAGDLLNWVLARRAEDREVVFSNPHRLIALFFGAMGINEHAKVKLQNT